MDRGRHLLVALLCCLPPGTTQVLGDVKLPAVFASHMVLQRGMPVPIWGWAEPGEKVTVTFDEQTKTTTAGADGKWMVKLAPLSVGPARSLSISGRNRIDLADVLVGEVWICSGQSNMAWTVAAAIDPDLEAAAANYPQIRLLKVAQHSTAEAQADVTGLWSRCSPQSVPAFSAVGYYFGRQLHRNLGVPVGLIHTAWGGTRAEAWTKPGDFAAEASLKPLGDWWDNAIGSYDAAAEKRKHEAALAKWKQAAAKAKEQNKRPPRRPVLRGNPADDRHRPGNLYNGMIAPLVPFAVRGAIWYQGESNAGRAYQYRTIFPLMINSWRRAWGRKDLSFYWVQLANFRAVKDEPGESDWAELREAQSLTRRLPHTGEAIITDLGAALDIHPKNKQDVGKRLARLALVDLYQKGGKLARSGPVYTSHQIKGNKVILRFDDLGGGPNTKLATWYRQPLRGFSIAGPDRNFVWAEARIAAANTVEVWHESIPAPAAVRYNWADNPTGNLYNTYLLPAGPFRTDDWPGITVDKHH